MTDTTRPKRYRMVSKYYKETYGEKVYKLPVALPLTCPNRALADIPGLELVRAIADGVLAERLDVLVCH